MSSLPNITFYTSNSVVKNIETKLNLQSVELSQRAKVIDDLRKSLSLLINKYNDLKKEYDKQCSYSVRKLRKSLQLTIQNHNFNILNENTCKKCCDYKSKLIVSTNQINLLKLENDKLISKEDEYTRNIEQMNEKIRELNNYKHLYYEIQNKIVNKEFNNHQYEPINEINIEYIKINFEHNDYRNRLDLLTDELNRISNKLKETELIIVNKDNEIMKNKCLLNNIIEVSKDSFKKIYNESTLNIINLQKKFFDKIKFMKIQFVNIYEIINKFSNFNEKIKMLSLKINNLENEKSKLNKIIVKHMNTIKEHEDSNFRNKNIVLINEKTIVDLNMKIESLNREINLVINKRNDEIEIADNNEKEILNLKNENIKLYKDIEHMKEKLNQYKIENQGKSKIIEERNEEIRNLMSKVS